MKKNSPHTFSIETLKHIVLQNDLDNFQIKFWNINEDVEAFDPNIIISILEKSLSLFAFHALESETSAVRDLVHFNFIDPRNQSEFYTVEIDFLRTSQQGIYYVDAYCYDQIGLLAGKCSCIYENESFNYE